MNKIKSIVFSNYQKSCEIFHHLSYLIHQEQEAEQTKPFIRSNKRFSKKSENITEELNPIEIGLLFICLKMRSKQDVNKAMDYIIYHGYEELSNYNKQKLENKVVNIYYKYIK